MKPKALHYLLLVNSVLLLFENIRCSPSSVLSAHHPEERSRFPRVGLGAKTTASDNEEDQPNILTGLQQLIRSIETKLTRLEDPFAFSTKLTRFEFSLEQIMRKLENVEGKLGNLDARLDMRLSKVESVLLGSDFSYTHVLRRLEDVHDKVTTKSALLDNKFDLRMESVTTKLDRMHGQLQTSSNSLSEKLDDMSEGKALFESQALNRLDSLERMERRVAEMDDLLKGLGLETKASRRLTLVEEALAGNHSVQSKLDNLDQDMKDVNKTLTLVSNYLMADSPPDQIDPRNRLRTVSDLPSISLQQQETEIASSENQLLNISSTLHQTLVLHKNKFQELDEDVEIYTRKVLNNIQALWKSANEMETYLNETMDLGNRTRKLVKDGFKRLSEQLDPLPKLEPKLVNLRTNLEEKVRELSTIIDNSFAAISIAQNYFIDSCHRIQDEEVQLYDILKEMMAEMRNRSNKDIDTITTAINGHSSHVDEKLENILNLLVKVIKRIKQEKTPTTDDEHQVQCRLSREGLDQVQGICRQALSASTSSSAMSFVDEVKQ